MIKSLFQTKPWGEFKEKFGWKAESTSGLIGLERTIGFGKSLLYFPELPLNEQTAGLIDEIKTGKRPTGRIFSRFEFLELWTSERAKQLLETGLVKAFEDVQPDYRQWVVLDKSEAELLKDMRPKGRYNIKVAERHKLKVEWGTEPEKLESFVRLYQGTAKRTGFSGRGDEYFRALVATLNECELGEVVTVSHEGEVLSAAIIAYYGGVASYLYGGSGGDRALMAPYLMHWEAIKRAKKKGCAIYDLLAIAPPGEEKHIHAGLTRFKTQFGGQSVRMLGSWDLVHNRLWYRLYRFAETRRRRAI
ncbi:MAG: peptidoglycan bridge formation glycyltransferase FemA/FemB family protein [Candidatus Berkelbacteria bacterium]|nr:MAG: peptidoglycan bridge formation glycyltransferase FemA/FemB family protein [Candidatus Berkelbacteria bacterium]QQG51734.1 MAG: peptidoglycan bridge formation glycyltransferase FemA/FemB family protein [Candidatus Berkelbacteria bacterium]